LQIARTKEKKTSIPTYKTQDEETLFQQRLDEAYKMKKYYPMKKPFQQTWLAHAFHFFGKMKIIIINIFLHIPFY
jgi:hypothetical protein